MKKYLSFMAFAMMAVFCLSFVSCGDDDDESTNPNPSEGTNSDGDSEGVSFSITMDGEKLYGAKKEGTDFRNLLAFIDGQTEVPCRASFMDAEDWDHSTYYYELMLCFSRFSLADVGSELELCPVSWKATGGYGSWEFQNSFSYVKKARDGKVDQFAYVSGKITFHGLNVEKRELQVKYDNVVFECVKHDDSNMKRDQIILNGICAYNYYSEK